uniref:Uncharacterized protein n=1 Tax=Glossina palpalis gambiensis TaxID=67801 RepID=A0A1B0BG70_9MUSC
MRAGYILIHNVSNSSTWHDIVAKQRRRNKQHRKFENNNKQHNLNRNTFHTRNLFTMLAGRKEYIIEKQSYASIIASEECDTAIGQMVAKFMIIFI